MAASISSRGDGAMRSTGAADLSAAGAGDGFFSAAGDFAAVGAFDLLADALRFLSVVKGIALDADLVAVAVAEIVAGRRSDPAGKRIGLLGRNYQEPLIQVSFLNSPSSIIAVALT